MTANSIALIDDVAISTGCAIANGSFEGPVLAKNAYVVNPSGASWTFTGVAGVSTDVMNDKSYLTQGNSPTPDGYQVAFIQDTGTMSQSVYLAPGVYNLSFLAAQCAQHQSQAQTLEVFFGSQEIGMATPSNPADAYGHAAGTTFGLYETNNFTVTTAGTYTITFKGLVPASVHGTTTADSTALIDDVQLNV